MGLKGKFALFSPTRTGCTIKVWQFVLTNTNLLLPETVDVMLCDSFGQRPFYFRDIRLKAGQSVAFDTDTVDWSWYQDDFAAIIDKNNRILKKWVHHIPEYKPGECPECHGTHKCRACRGKAFVYPGDRIWEARACERCGGTGTCHTCFITRRKPIPGMGPTGLRPF